jgi:hypothetical protein
LRFRHLTRGGIYHRVAEPDWDEPLDARPGVTSGGRWNRPGSFPVLYLNQTVRLARLFVAHKLAGLPYGPEDLDPDSAPVLVDVDVATDSYVDIVSDQGCTTAGLPTSYPLDHGGSVIPHQRCWPIGEEAQRRGEPGIACRSAIRGASLSDEELAWFQKDDVLQAAKLSDFAEWFYA